MPNDNNKGRSAGILARVLLILRKTVGLNIGTMVFSLILVYMAVSAILYMTADHIETYQVTSGPLARNETYTGLSIREEVVCHASSGGYIGYYAREGSKINAGGVVYGLSSTQVPETTASLNDEDLAKVRADMLSFSKGFDSNKFNATYSFMYQLEGNILQYVGVTAQVSSTPTVLEDGSVVSNGSSANANQSSVRLGNQTLCKSDYDGIVLYSKDGYEGKTIADLTLSDFYQSNYHMTNLKTSGTVGPGDDIYTILTDEDWSLLIPLTEKQAAKLRSRSVIRVKFLKDDMTQTGDFSIINIEGQSFGQIRFDKGLVRYARDRFLDIELVTNSTTGLKIPLTSIVTKEFYIIPESFSTDEGTSFYKEVRDKSGKASMEQVTPIIYASLSDENSTFISTEETKADNTWLYVDKSAFQKGDVIIKDLYSQDRYVVGETDILEGVYCINPGYAVFRRIEVMDQNEEYAIVEKDTKYGLVRYDHIVKNADSVKEEDILY